MTTITIEGKKYSVNCSSKTAHAIMYKILDWMQEEDNIGCQTGEGLYQNINCRETVMELMADIIDGILEPQLTEE